MVTRNPGSEGGLEEIRKYNLQKRKWRGSSPSKRKMILTIWKLLDLLTTRGPRRNRWPLDQWEEVQYSTRTLFSR